MIRPHVKIASVPRAVCGLKGDLSLYRTGFLFLVLGDCQPLGIGTFCIGGRYIDEWCGSIVVSEIII